jgi:DNA-binding NarL/FixJ family response regulator
MTSNKQANIINIGLVDDHQLFLKSLSLMLNSFGNYKVVLEALNGKELCEKLTTTKPLPDIILMDVNMPVMDGLTATKQITPLYPGVKLVALSMNDDDSVIINMLRSGCCAYLLKDTHPDELEKALEEIYTKGYYNADAANVNFRRLLLAEQQNGGHKITEKELSFLQYACTDLTYKQIAHTMKLSERTIDGYRESLFGKLKVQSRVGLAMEALRKGLIKL